MAENRIKHGVLCKQECTICTHERRSNLLLGGGTSFEKYFLICFNFKLLPSLQDEPQ